MSPLLPYNIQFKLLSRNSKIIESSEAYTGYNKIKYTIFMADKSIALK